MEATEKIEVLEGENEDLDIATLVDHVSGRKDIARESALRSPEAGSHCLRRSHDVERFYVTYGRKVAEDKDSQEMQVPSRLEIEMERIAVRRVCGERVVSHRV